MEEQRRRIDGRGHVEIREDGEPVVKSILPHELPAEPELHALPLKIRRAGIAQPAAIGRKVGLQGGTARIEQGKSRHHPIEQIVHAGLAGVFPGCRGLGPEPAGGRCRLGRRAGGGDPVEHALAHGSRRGGRPGGLTIQFAVGRCNGDGRRGGRSGQGQRYHACHAGTGHHQETAAAQPLEPRPAACAAFQKNQLTGSHADFDPET